MGKSIIGYRVKNSKKNRNRLQGGEKVYFCVCGYYFYVSVGVFDHKHQECEIDRSRAKLCKKPFKKFGVGVYEFSKQKCLCDLKCQRHITENLSSIDVEDRLQKELSNKRKSASLFEYDYVSYDNEGSECDCWDCAFANYEISQDKQKGRGRGRGRERGTESQKERLSRYYDIFLSRKTGRQTKDLVVCEDCCDDEDSSSYEIVKVIPVASETSSTESVTDESFIDEMCRANTACEVRLTKRCPDCDGALEQLNNSSEYETDEERSGGEGEGEGEERSEDEDGDDEVQVDEILVIYDNNPHISVRTENENSEQDTFDNMCDDCVCDIVKDACSDCINEMVKDSTMCIDCTSDILGRPLKDGEIAALLSPSDIINFVRAKRLDRNLKHYHDIHQNIEDWNKLKKELENYRKNRVISSEQTAQLKAKL